MPSTKTLQQIAQKWATRAGAAAADYTTGIQATPPGKWETAAQAAEQAWESGVTAAVGSKRFARGVTGKGQKWLTQASTLGGQRFGQGVANAQPHFSAGFGPYLNIINATDLGPRGARGAMGNYARSQKLGDALHMGRVAAGT